MKRHIRQTLNDINEELDRHELAKEAAEEHHLQLARLREGLLDFFGGDADDPIEPNVPVKRGRRGSYKKRREVSGEPPETLPLDKPTTLGGAAKAIIRGYGKKPFTLQEIIAALEADTDYAKYYQDSSGPGAIYTNLAYWSKGGKLNKSGEGQDASYTVADAEFFAKPQN